MFVKKAGGVVKEVMSCGVQLKLSAVRTGRIVILVIFREYDGPVPGFQCMPFLLIERPFALNHKYLPLRFVSPQALNHQPPAKGSGYKT